MACLIPLLFLRSGTGVVPLLAIRVTQAVWLLNGIIVPWSINSSANGLGHTIYCPKVLQHNNVSDNFLGNTNNSVSALGHTDSSTIAIPCLADALSHINTNK